MTRFLSHSLQASEPSFRYGLNRLEVANGRPSTDIRLTSEINLHTQQKLLELGLNPRDTTAEELFHILQHKVKNDDIKLSKTLRTQAASHVSAEGDVIDGMIHALSKDKNSMRCYSIKMSSMKSILKAVPPKKAMKKLHYRSIDSFLKHESPISIMSAAWLVEGVIWQKKLLDKYRKLQPRDFETRHIQLVHMKQSRWASLANSVVNEHHHNLISLRELGALVFLPIDDKVPAGGVTASLSMALHELNEIRAASTFLQLNQVKSNFGEVVKTIVCDEALLNSSILDQQVPWNLVHRYYAKLNSKFKEEIFEPYIQLEDMVWQPIENTLTEIEPSLKFWKGTSHLGLLDGHKAVSLNILDSALSYCNNLPYEKRAIHYFQKSLWHELLMRYLNHKPVEDSMLAELQPQLATQEATN